MVTPAKFLAHNNTTGIEDVMQNKSPNKTIAKHSICLKNMTTTNMLTLLTYLPIHLLFQTL